jgi:hypothetical protein
VWPAQKTELQLNEKRCCVEKKEWWGKNKNVTKTHRHRLLKATCERGIAAADSYLPSKLREGSWRCRRHSNKIEKGCSEKT